jgi:hypothetical protein
MERTVAGIHHRSRPSTKCSHPARASACDV